MRFVHTSDWHLGRTLRGHSLHEAQAEAVRGLVASAIAEQADAFVVAGDVFDRPVPPIESLRLLNEAVSMLADAGIAVILTAGNHDSGERLATYSDVLRDGVHVVGSLDAVGAGIEVADGLAAEHGPVVVYALPYLHPDVARERLSDGEPLPRSHEAVVVAAMERIDADLAERARTTGSRPRAVVVGHAFVAAGGLTVETSDSERDLSVGGVQVVPADAFANLGIDYVALGHLHRPQVVRVEAPRVAYSGSLLRYSVSEAGHGKQALLVDLGAPGSAPVVREVEIAQPRGMSRVRGALADVIGPASDAVREHFVEVTITDTVLPDGAHHAVSAAFPHLLEMRYEPEGRDPAIASMRGDARGQQPVDVLLAFMQKVTGGMPTEVEQRVLAAAYEQARDDLAATSSANGAR